MVEGSPLWNVPIPESIQPFANRPASPCSFQRGSQMTAVEALCRTSRPLVPYSSRKSVLEDAWAGHSGAFVGIPVHGVRVGIARVHREAFAAVACHAKHRCFVR